MQKSNVIDSKVLFYFFCFIIRDVNNKCLLSLEDYLIIEDRRNLSGSGNKGSAVVLHSRTSVNEPGHTHLCIKACAWKHFCLV